MNRCVQALVVRLLTAVVVCIVSCERGSAQAQSAADGPWAGWAQCVLTGQLTSQGQSYFHQQTHTWVLTGSTPGPASTSAIKQYAATWQVTGQGTRDRGQGRSEQWTTVGQPTPDTLTIVTRTTAATPATSQRTRRRAGSIAVRVETEPVRRNTVVIRRRGRPWPP